MPKHAKTKLSTAAITLLGALLLSGCSAATPQSDVRGAMIGVGSSASHHAISAWADGWTKANKAVSLQFSPDGAATGKSALFAGTSYFASLDAPLTESDISDSQDVCGPRGAFSVPATVVPVGVTYNLGDVKGLRLDMQTLAGIYSGTITRWQDPVIVEQNAGRELPDADIVPIYAAESSSLNAVFTRFLADAAPQTWTAQPADTLPEIPNGKAVPKFASLGTEVDNQSGSIAFTDMNFIWTGLPLALLDFGSGYVEPTKSSLQNAITAGTTTTSANAVTQTLSIGPDDSYPLAAVEHQALCFEYPHAGIANMAKSWGQRVLSPAGQDSSNTFAKTASPSSEALQASKFMVQAISAAQ